MPAAGNFLMFPEYSLLGLFFLVDKFLKKTFDVLETFSDFFHFQTVLSVLKVFFETLNGFSALNISITNLLRKIKVIIREIEG